MKVAMSIGVGRDMENLEMGLQNADLDHYKVLRKMVIYVPNGYGDQVCVFFLRKRRRKREIPTLGWPSPCSHSFVINRL